MMLFFDGDEVAQQAVGFHQRDVGQRGEAAFGHAGDDHQPFVAAHQGRPLLGELRAHAQVVVVF